jgi:hypothetical protein
MESLSNSTLDVIKKPRTNYSKNVLRRAVPNVNIQEKKESITMSKLKVLTMLKLQKSDDTSRKVKTVDNIPKILTIVAGSTKRRGSKTRQPALIIQE